MKEKPHADAHEAPEYEYEDRLFPAQDIPQEPHAVNLLTLRLFMDLYAHHANAGRRPDDSED